MLPALLLATLVGALQIVVSHGAVERELVPSPAEVAGALWSNRTVLWENTWVTLQEILFGLVLGVFAGVLLAIAMRFSALVRTAGLPLAVATQAVPLVAIGPVLVIWLGYGIFPKILIVALAAFFPILINTLDGLRSVDGETVKMMRTLDGSPWAIFCRVEAPTALPSFFSGAKIAVAIAPIVALFAELVGASSGLMVEIIQDNAQLETARVFAAVVILALIGVLLVTGTALAERMIIRWH